jgi:hypothetical protein
MFGNRAIYHDGWFARTIHKAPWETSSRAGARRRRLGTLRHVAPTSAWPTTWPRSTRRSSNRAAGPVPAGGREEQRAADRRPHFERTNPNSVGRPDLMAGRTSLTLAEGMTGMTENVFLNIKNRPRPSPPRSRCRRAAPTARSSRRAAASAAGRSTSRTACRPTTTTSSAWSASRSGRRAAPPGKATIRFEFAYDGGGPGKGGTGTLFVNDEKVAEGASSAPSR